MPCACKYRDITDLSNEQIGKLVHIRGTDADLACIRIVNRNGRLLMEFLYGEGCPCAEIPGSLAEN